MSVDVTGTPSGAEQGDLFSATPTEQVSDATPASSTGNDATAASSPAQPEDDRAGLLAAIQDAVKPKEETPKLEAADISESDTGDKTSAEVEADIPDTELSTYSGGAQKRIRDLVSKTKEMKAALEAVQPELETHRHFERFLATNDLKPDDVNALMGVGAALRKGDFQTFLAGVLPYVELAQQAVGQRLPPDIQRQVEEGYISEEAARELSVTRFQSQHLQTQLQDRDHREQTQAVEQHRSAINAAMKSWDSTIRQRDPDFARKEDAVRDYARIVVAERGVPRTVQEAVEYANEALSRVNKTFGKVAGSPLRPTRPTPGSSHNPSTGVAEPRTLAEAAMAGLRAHRSAS